MSRKVVKIDRFEYARETKSIIGVKTLRFDFFLAEDGKGSLIPELKIFILSSNIKDFQERYALLGGNRLYLFLSVLERATFYSNFIYSFGYPTDFKGGVEMLSVRMDNKRGNQENDEQSKKRDSVGVISMKFFQPLKTTKIKDNDRNSSFFYLQPLELMGLFYRTQEILTSIRTMAYAVRYGQDIATLLRIEK